MLEIGLISLEIYLEKNHLLTLASYAKTILALDYMLPVPFVLQYFLMQIHTAFSLCGHPYLHAKFDFAVWHINTREGFLIKV